LPACKIIGAIWLAIAPVPTTPQRKAAAGFTPACSEAPNDGLLKVAANTPAPAACNSRRRCELTESDASGWSIACFILFSVAGHFCVGCRRSKPDGSAAPLIHFIITLFMA
jgi:hypothetical protein